MPTTLDANPACARSGRCRRSGSGVAVPGRATRACSQNDQSSRGSGLAELLQAATLSRAPILSSPRPPPQSRWHLPERGLRPDWARSCEWVGLACAAIYSESANTRAVIRERQVKGPASTAAGREAAVAWAGRCNMAAASAAETGNQAFLDAVAADNAELVHSVIKTDARAVSMEDEVRRTPGAARQRQGVFGLSLGALHVAHEGQGRRHVEGSRARAGSQRAAVRT